MKQQQNETPPETGPNNLLLFCAYAALVPELLLHDPRTFGIRSVGPRGGGAVVATYIFAICYTTDNKTPLLMLALLTALLAIFAYFYALVRERRGEMFHSRYNGRPWLVALFPKSEEQTKRCEPILLIVTGWGLHHWNCPLGTFVIVAGTCHGIRTLAAYLATRTRELDFNDALTEQTVAIRAMNRRRRR